MPKEKIVGPAARGMVTEEAAAYWKEATGRTLTTVELRLLPFIQYCVMNGGEVEGRKVSYDEQKVLRSLQVNCWIIFKRKPQAPGWYQIGVSADFWHKMNHLLLLTYVWTRA